MDRLISVLTNGYYEPLIVMLDRCVTENFMNVKHLQMWKFVSKPEEVINAINDSVEWDEGAINFALST